MKLNKNVLIVFLLLSVFAIGTLNFAETVDAAKWKKYNSGKFTSEYPAAGDKKTMTYQSYTKGNNELYVNIYSYSKKTNKKKLDTKITFSKKNGVMKTNIIDYSWKYESPGQFKTSYSVKTVYKSTMKETIEGLSTHPKKKAYSIETIKVNKNTFKAYGIENSENHISGIIYRNNEEYVTLSIYKENNKITLDKYNKKRVISSSKTFSGDQSLKSIYKKEIDKIFANAK